MSKMNNLAVILAFLGSLYSGFLHSQGSGVSETDVCMNKPKKWVIFYIDEKRETFHENILESTDTRMHSILSQLNTLNHADTIDDVIPIFGKKADEIQIVKHLPNAINYKWAIVHGSLVVGYAVRFRKGCILDVSATPVDGSNTLIIRGYGYPKYD